MYNDHKGVPVLIASEEPIARYGIRRLLETEKGLSVMGEAANSSETIKRVRDLNPEILVLDLTMAASGTDVLSDLASLQSGVRIIAIVAAVEQNQVVDAFGCGVRGVLFKNSATHLLLNCVRSVIAGQYWAGEQAVSTVVDAVRGLMLQRGGARSPKRYGLTARELEIIAAIVTGCSNKDVGRKYSIAERTVKHHLSNIYDKLGLSNRLELAVFAVNHHLEGDNSRHSDFRADVDPKVKYQDA